MAAAYERVHGAWSRLDQMARLYLFHPSSAVYSCPLAMTDGAARFLELLELADAGRGLRLAGGRGLADPLELAGQRRTVPGERRAAQHRPGREAGQRHSRPWR